MTGEVLRTHADLAKKLNLPLSTTVEMRKREGWPHIRLGKHVRFTDQMVEEIVSSHVVSTVTVKHPVFEGQRPSRGRRSA